MPFRLKCCCVEDISETNHENVIHKRRRSCTDCSFLVLFLFFCGGLGCIAWYGVENGDLYRVVFGSDSFGNTCGRDNSPIWIRSSNNGPRKKFRFSGLNMSDRKFMLPLNSSQVLDTIWICVHECPKETITSYEVLSTLVKNHNNLCVNHDSVFNVTKESVRSGICPQLPILKSVNVMNRCIPENLFNFGKELLKKVVHFSKNSSFSAVDMDLIRGYMHDIMDTSAYFLQTCLVALALSISSVFLLRYFAAFIIHFIYLSVAVFVLGISACICYVFWTLCSRSVGLEVFNTTHSRMIPEETITSAIQQRIATAVLLKDVDFDDLLNCENTSTLTSWAIGLGALAVPIFSISMLWCVWPRGKKMVRLFNGASLVNRANFPLLKQSSV
ncbi:hypothetical protein DICVIV_08832 [Dictyocaulus viviparus]|uniref:Uncharacterized protein n=1 Tax=Dictyocaulus viviparus TaxID=29172 RepID=A0A0D8XN07_DICVI|nr:hypothetical protein DICVIV_08832 [Dictyocaulus viviparus]